MSAVFLITFYSSVSAVFPAFGELFCVSAVFLVFSEFCVFLVFGEFYESTACMSSFCFLSLVWQLC